MVSHKHSTHTVFLTAVQLIEVGALVLPDAVPDLAVVDVGALSRGLYQVGVVHVLEPGALAVAVDTAVGRVQP